MANARKQNPPSEEAASAAQAARSARVAKNAADRSAIARAALERNGTPLSAAAPLPAPGVANSSSSPPTGAAATAAQAAAQQARLDAVRRHNLGEAQLAAVELPEDARIIDLDALAPLAPHLLAPADFTPAGAAAAQCPRCQDRGFLVQAEGAVPCVCAAGRRASAAWRQAEIPRKFRTKTFEGFRPATPNQRAAVQALRAYGQSFRPRASEDHPTNGFLLTGGPGTGKTHLAIATLRTIAERGYQPLYANVPELFLELRRQMTPGEANRTEGDIIDAALRADMLLLDDLGAELTSNYVLDRLYVIINGRYQHDRALMITSNLSLDELGRQLSPRIASRLAEMCQAIHFPEGDHRRQHLK